MKVTIVHQYFKHPREGGAIRSYYLAKGLIQAGHEVEVITAHNESKLEIRRIEGIKVYYLPIYYSNHLGKYQRIWAFVKYVFMSIGILHKVKKPQYLYVISTPLTVGVVALWSKWILRVKYIFEIGDLWPEAPIQLGYIQNPLLKRILYRFESLVYNQAHRIVAMSPDIERIINRGKKVLMIPNMSDCEFFKSEEKDPILLEKFKLSDELVIAYLGTAGRANHLDYLLQAALKSEREQVNIRFLVAAEGSELEHFRATVIDNKLSNVIITDYTNKEGVKDLLRVSDAVYVSFAKVPILASGSPNKFFDGLAAGKLVITNFGGWVANEIADAHCGFNYDPTNTDEFLDKIIPFIENRELLEKYKNNARNLAESKFSKRLLINEWLTLFS